MSRLVCAVAPENCQRVVRDGIGVPSLESSTNFFLLPVMLPPVSHFIGSKNLDYRKGDAPNRLAHGPNVGRGCQTSRRSWTQRAAGQEGVQVAQVAFVLYRTVAVPY